LLLHVFTGAAIFRSLLQDIGSLGL
jgi:hypothetical protein